MASSRATGHGICNLAHLSPDICLVSFHDVDLRRYQDLEHRWRASSSLASGVHELAWAYRSDSGKFRRGGSKTRKGCLIFAVRDHAMQLSCRRAAESPEALLEQYQSGLCMAATFSHPRTSPHNADLSHKAVRQLCVLSRRDIHDSSSVRLVSWIPCVSRMSLMHSIVS